MRLKIISQRIGNWVMGHKVRFFLIAGVLAIAVVLMFDFRNGFDWAGILVEAHGMLFDIILFGIILAIYDSITDKEDRIERYKEEIEDYLGWDEKEATFRIVGNIKRLNRLGVSKINLINANLNHADLCNTKLFGATLHYADLKKANLSGAYLGGASLGGVSLMGANLSGANLIVASLSDADLRGASLMATNLCFTSLKNADLYGANLIDADLYRAVAYKSQKEAFQKVMTKEQINSMIWVDDPEEVLKANVEKVPDGFCGALTQKGSPCKNKPKAEHDRCHVHIKDE